MRPQQDIYMSPGFPVFVKTSEFYYDLPKEFIAQEPMADRPSSKLLTLDLPAGSISHGIFRDIVDEFESGDMLVLNDTKVIPARLFGTKPTGGKAEALIVKRLGVNRYEVFIKGKNIRAGSVVDFKSDTDHLQMLVGKRSAGIRYEVEFISAEDGEPTGFNDDDGQDGTGAGDLIDLETRIYAIGVPPTPPYIKGVLRDAEKYQTVFAQHPGSIAAPTAGFHFTDELFQKLREKGVDIRFVTLHVGVGTFNPVRSEDIEEHRMEVEVYTVEKETADALNEQIEKGGRTWLVGTTSLRTLESAMKDGKVQAGSNETGIFIYPGYEFKFPFHRFITNFHLPESTLIMLVSAITGTETILGAYEAAKKEKYRFYSFGDACLIKR